MVKRFQAKYWRRIRRRKKEIRWAVVGKKMGRISARYLWQLERSIVPPLNPDNRRKRMEQYGRSILVPIIRMEADG